MSYSLLKHTEEFLIRERFRGHSATHFYPSEASVKFTDSYGDEVVWGQCLRQSYFRCVGEKPSPTSARTQLIFLMGKAVETMLIEQWKQMGIYVADGVRFNNPKHNIYGELDVVLREPGTNKTYCCEIKSFYGYYASKQILGSRGIAPRPKENQLLQTLVYAMEFRKKFDYCKMFYLERGDVGRQEFDVRVVPDDSGGNGDILYRPMVNGNIIKQFTVNDIYKRFAELAERIEAKNPPPKDFQLLYDDERIRKDFANGKISKSKFEKFFKKSKRTGEVTKNEKERPGDWNCSYCGHKSLCYK